MLGRHCELWRALAIPAGGHFGRRRQSLPCELPMSRWNCEPQALPTPAFQLTLHPHAQFAIINMVVAVSGCSAVLILCVVEYIPVPYFPLEITANKQTNTVITLMAPLFAVPTEDMGELGRVFISDLENDTELTQAANGRLLRVHGYRRAHRCVIRSFPPPSSASHY
ncbi:hypothetical protein C8R44DRAFT_876543 [Mycena epipterygia]|nr:hypothetical protein C8R44DRAFT_876543 [Mycena epipterygia]